MPTPHHFCINFISTFYFDTSFNIIPRLLTLTLVAYAILLSKRNTIYLISTRVLCTNERYFVNMCAVCFIICFVFYYMFDKCSNNKLSILITFTHFDILSFKMLNTIWALKQRLLSMGSGLCMRANHGHNIFKQFNG